MKWIPELDDSPLDLAAYKKDTFATNTLQGGREPYSNINHNGVDRCLKMAEYMLESARTLARTHV